MVAPAGSVPGQQIPISTPDGTQFQCTIPAGVQPGETFQVPVSTGAPLNESSQLKKARIPKYGGLEHVQGEGPVEGQAISCALICFGVVTLILCLVLAMNVSAYFPLPFVTSCWSCGPFGGNCFWTFCQRVAWITTNPISVDALPYRGNDTGVPPGDGQPDNWSLIVALSTGVTGCLLIVCCVAPSALRRGGPLKAVACGAWAAFLLHIAAVISMTIQLIWSRNQWVYNAFITNTGTNYVYIFDRSIASYWAGDSYYRCASEPHSSWAAPGRGASPNGRHLPLSAPSVAALEAPHQPSALQRPSLRSAPLRGSMSC